MDTSTRLPVLGTMVTKAFLESNRRSMPSTSINLLDIHHRVSGESSKPSPSASIRDFVGNMSQLSSLPKESDGPNPILSPQSILSQLLRVHHNPHLSSITPSSLSKTASMSVGVSAARTMPAALSLGTKRRGRTGVYFNNREVEGESQICHDVRLSNQVSTKLLPLGKPLGIPPRLKLAAPVMTGKPSLGLPPAAPVMNGKPSLGPPPAAKVPTPHHVLNKQPIVIVENKTSPEERPKKRPRNSVSKSLRATHNSRLSDEQQVFLEAALALAACKNASVSDDNKVEQTSSS